MSPIMYNNVSCVSMSLIIYSNVSCVSMSPIFYIKLWWMTMMSFSGSTPSIHNIDNRYLTHVGYFLKTYSFKIASRLYGICRSRLWMASATSRVAHQGKVLRMLLSSFRYEEHSNHLITSKFSSKIFSVVFNVFVSAFQSFFRKEAS